MTREIILDTETTGLDPRRGDRVVEIACIVLEDYVPTGDHFHCYINPERDMPPEAERVHGLSAAFLADKPLFSDDTVGRAFLEFVGEATLIAHNAPFDRGFINHELSAAGLPTIADSRWVDTLALAQARFPGMRNSLDALCQRFKISLAEREKHGALIDTKLLAAVYLELRGGRERRLDLDQQAVAASAGSANVAVAYGARPRPLVSRITETERQAHAEFIATDLKGSPLWAAFEG